MNNTFDRLNNYCKYKSIQIIVENETIKEKYFVSLQINYSDFIINGLVAFIDTQGLITKLKSDSLLSVVITDPMGNTYINDFVIISSKKLETGKSTLTQLNFIDQISYFLQKLYINNAFKSVDLTKLATSYINSLRPILDKQKIKLDIQSNPIILNNFTISQRMPLLNVLLNEISKQGSYIYQDKLLIRLCELSEIDAGFSKFFYSQNAGEFSANLILDARFNAGNENTAATISPKGEIKVFNQSLKRFEKVEVQNDLVNTETKQRDYGNKIIQKADYANNSLNLVVPHLFKNTLEVVVPGNFKNLKLFNHVYLMFDTNFFKNKGIDSLDGEYVIYSLDDLIIPNYHITRLKCYKI